MFMCIFTHLSAYVSKDSMCDFVCIHVYDHICEYVTVCVFMCVLNCVFLSACIHEKLEVNLKCASLGSVHLVF